VPRSLAKGDHVCVANDETTELARITASVSLVAAAETLRE
jgi:hypothetical protein